MRRFTLSILCAILCGGLSAQSETTSRYGFFDNILHAIPMSDGNIAVLNQRYLVHSELYIMDGEDLTRIASFDVSSHIDVFEGMVLGTDNSIFVLGSLGQCDYIFDERSLIKIDLSGNGNGWVETFDYTQSFNYQGFDNALQTGPDGGVWVHGDDNWQPWVLYDNQGNDIGDGGGYFGIYNDWDVATQEAVITASGDLLLLTYNIVRLYDSQFNLLHSTTLDDNLFGDIGVRPIVTSDSQYIYIFNPNDPAKLMRMDYNLQIINEVNWNIGDDVKAMIAHDNDSLTVIGNDYHHIYAKEISNSFNFVETEPDVGIVEILNADIISYDCGGGTCEYNIENIEIVVQNYGTQPLTYYEINSPYNDECSWLCNSFLVYDTYNNLLLPGEQDTVAFRDMQFCVYQELEEDFCFYTTRPNAMVDKNHDNDRICANFDIFLPIELLTPLQAKIENKTAILTWETATETNNAGFEIQKSGDGFNWEKIAWVDGRGDTFTPHAYTYTDENLLSGITYYRFKQLDFDGKFSYSNVASVQRAVSNISIQPNPVKNILYITDLNGYTIEQVNVFDQTGKQVISTKTANNSVDVSNLAAGIYIIELHMEGGMLYEKIVVE